VKQNAAYYRIPIMSNFQKKCICTAYITDIRIFIICTIMGVILAFNNVVQYVLILQSTDRHIRPDYHLSVTTHDSQI